MKPSEVIPLARQLAGEFDPALIMAFCEVESSFNERAFRDDRNGGSYGLMQLDVPTARDRGFRGKPDELFIPGTNLAYGVLQLEWIKRYLKPRGAFGLQAMIAAYNEGVRNVLRGNPDARYVARVIDAFNRWRVAMGEGVT